MNQKKPVLPGGRSWHIPGSLLTALPRLPQVCRLPWEPHELSGGPKRGGECWPGRTLCLLPQPGLVHTAGMPAHAGGASDPRMPDPAG